PVAWFASKPDDDEPPRFWRLLRSAVRASGALRDEDVAADAPGDAAADPFDLLFRDVQKTPLPFVLIIDDAHVLMHPEIVDGLDCLVQLGHSQLQLVLAARSDP